MKTKVIRMNPQELDMEGIREAGEILRQGGLVAFPTETVYGLGGNGLDPQASARFLRTEVDKWRGVIKTARITLD